MRRALVILLVLAAAGCAGPPPIQPPIQPPLGAAERAAATDWSTAETVTVTMEEFDFAPSELTLRAGRPVRLRIVNGGSRAHDWTSAGFFRAVALRQGDPVSAQVLQAGGSIEVPAGQAREVLLLPLLPGSHDVICAKPLHATLGMAGRVTISP
jgi:uncharacterized cupredoxin-like copper-binding protein